MKKNKDSSYCELIINPKLEKVAKDFAVLLKEDELKKIHENTNTHNR